MGVTKQVPVASLPYICPACGSEGVLAGAASARCRGCGWDAMPIPGVYDLTARKSGGERAFYERVYKEQHGMGGGRSLAELRTLWERADLPENVLVRRRLGSVQGKRVLVLGNGVSAKELALLAEEPALVVVSDLSLEAMVGLRAVSDSLGLSERAVFAAVDAMQLPFPANSFDIVYGFAMVHHLQDVESFLRGVSGILVPGGSAVFMDDGYVTIWQASKRTWLRPAMWLAHRRTGISPEDYRFTMSGGFKENVLAEMIRAVGGDPLFERTGLVTYFFYRGSEKLLPVRLNRRLRSPSIARHLARLDAALVRRECFRKNQVRLLWGFRTTAA